MKIFYIITNSMKDPRYEVTDEIVRLIKSEGAHAIIAKEDAKKCDREILSTVDCIISIGGDGTLIRAVGAFHEYDKPLIGVNLGTLGYLTEIEKNHLQEDIHLLVNGDTLIEERMMLSGNVNGIEEVSLNDVVLVRQGDLRTIRFRIYVNGAYLHSYKADGIIVSTPTGSTGYSMSAGGPIVEPTASLFIVTPICPHALNNRSIVLSSEDTIEIVLGNGKEGSIEEAGVSFDGGTMLPIRTGEKVKITKANKTLKLMKLSSVSFLETLREKMAGN